MTKWKKKKEECDKNDHVKLKARVQKAVVRTAITYGLEAAPLKKAEARKLDVTEMKMLRWMSGVTRMDRVKNDHIRGYSKSHRSIKESTGGKIKMVWTPDEKRRAARGKRSDGHGGRWNAKERKT